MANEFAPEGQIWVCGACLKVSPDLYGFQAKNSWDESCMLNAVLCYKDKLTLNACGSQVINVAEGAMVDKAPKEPDPSQRLVSYP